MTNKYLLISAFCILATTVASEAQLTAQQAVQGMARGINIGNSLDAYPTETSWGNPPIVESYFANLKNAGFDAVRIPITWNNHTMSTPPYTIDSTFMARVDTVVHWALENRLFVIINAHHETWLKDSLSGRTITAGDSASITRFDSIWSQIATHFENASDSLIFEILNEPYPMTEQNVNMLNVRELKIIRKTNPTRVVSYSGYMWSNSDQLVTAEIPDSGSKYLIGYYHSYDPYPFGLQGGDTTDAAIYSVVKGKLDQVAAWSEKTGIPVILDEFGFMKNCAYNPRMYAYATVMDQALQHGVPAFAWDDGGDFAIYNRSAGTFNEIKDILIYTYPESPDELQIIQTTETSVRLQWHNRNAENDSITVQRSVATDTHFSNYAVVAPGDSVFIDNSISGANTYYYRLMVMMKDSTELQSYPIMLNATLTGITSNLPPSQFGLSQNFPNPFNPTTVIQYNVPTSGVVSLKVYDILGREVRTLVNKMEQPGRYSVTFNAERLPSGVYFYELRAGGHLRVKKSMFIK